MLDYQRVRFIYIYNIHICVCTYQYAPIYPHETTSKPPFANGFLVLVAEATWTLTTRQGKEHAAKAASDAQLEALQSPGSRGAGLGATGLSPGFTNQLSLQESNMAGKPPKYIISKWENDRTLTWKMFPLPCVIWQIQEYRLFHQYFLQK